HSEPIHASKLAQLSACRCRDTRKPEPGADRVIEVIHESVISSICESRSASRYADGPGTRRFRALFLRNRARIQSRAISRAVSGCSCTEPGHSGAMMPGEQGGERIRA